MHSVSSVDIKSSSSILCVQAYYPSPNLQFYVYYNFLSSLDVEVQRMKKAVESLMAANEEKVHLIIYGLMAYSDCIM